MPDNKMPDSVPRSRPLIPFLRPNLVRFEKYRHYLQSMDECRLYSNFGPLNSRLERRILDEHFDGLGSVCTVNNATTGLMLALSVSKRPRGRFAVMPSFTFAATPLAAMWAGLEPLFVDVRGDDFCISEASLDEALRRHGDEVAAVVPYAAFGQPLDLAPYESLARRGIPVVVDAAASFGATRDGAAFGSGFSGAAVYSFHATKAFGVGEGGLVYSADEALVARLRAAANFGFGPERISLQQGLNAKLPEILAAVGLAALDEFPQVKRRRIEIHRWYEEELARAAPAQRGWRMQRSNGEVAYQFFPLLAPPGVSNTAVVRALAAHGIELRTYFCPPCHTQPAFESCARLALPETEALARRALSLPLWNEMTRDNVASVVGGLAAAEAGAAR